jgi:hypothetical protein
MLLIRNQVDTVQIIKNVFDLEESKFPSDRIYKTITWDLYSTGEVLVRPNADLMCINCLDRSVFDEIL